MFYHIAVPLIVVSSSFFILQRIHCYFSLHVSLNTEKSLQSGVPEHQVGDFQVNSSHTICKLRLDIKGSDHDLGKVPKQSGYQISCVSILLPPPVTMESVSKVSRRDCHPLDNVIVYFFLLTCVRTQSLTSQSMQKVCLVTLLP